MTIRGKKHRATHIVSERHLEYLLGWSRADLGKLAAEAGGHYQPFDMRKPGSSKWRHIDNPDDQLKALQKAIHAGVLRRFELPEGMMGGVAGRSIRDNARRHASQPSVVTFDIADCFPSISSETVFEMFCREIKCREAIAHKLTQVTTLHHHVPQGAPTSMMIVNLALLPLYRDLLALCDTAGLTLSFWVDDIAISGPGAELVVDDVVRAAQRYGLSLPSRKIRVMGAHQAQRLTGMTVNRKPSVGSKYAADVAADIFALDGVAFVSDSEIRSIEGRICHVLRTNPGKADRLRRLADRILPAPNARSSPAKPERRRCTSSRRHRRHRLVHHG